MVNLFDEPQKIYHFHDLDKDEIREVHAWTEKGAWNRLMQIDNYQDRFRFLTIGDAEKPGSPNLS